MTVDLFHIHRRSSRDFDPTRVFAPFRAPLIGYTWLNAAEDILMGAISFNRFRRNPTKLLEEVAKTEEPLTITRAPMGAMW